MSYGERFDDDIYGADPANTGADGWPTAEERSCKTAPNEFSTGEKVAGIGCLLVVALVVVGFAVWHFFF